MLEPDPCAGIALRLANDINDNVNVTDRLVSSNGKHTPGAGPTEDTSHINCDTNNQKSTPVTCIDIVLMIVSFSVYIGDVVSDSWLAYDYYTRGRRRWFIFTLIAIIVPAFIVTILSFLWDVQDYQGKKEQHKKTTTSLRWMVIYVFFIFPIAPVLKYTEALIYGLRALTKKSTKKPEEQLIHANHDLALLTLLESFMEGAPQLMLQLYIMQTNRMADGMLMVSQIVACVIATLSLAWSPVAYHRALRRVLPEARNMTKAGMGLQFVWRLFTVSARVTAMSLFASSFTYWVFVIVVIHWGIMYIWILLQEWTFSVSHRRQQCFLNIVMALIYVFCYVALVDGRTRLRYLVYYVIVFIENTIMIVLWYIFAGTMNWWYIYPALITVFVGFFIGIVFQLIYYRWFHPEGSAIQLCVPCEELWILKTPQKHAGEPREPAEVEPQSA